MLTWYICIFLSWPVLTLIKTCVDLCWLCWPVMTHVDPCWPVLTSVGMNWPELTRVDIGWPVLTWGDLCWPELPCVEPCWPLFIPVDLCWRDSTSVGLSWPEFTAWRKMWPTAFILYSFIWWPAWRDGLRSLTNNIKMNNICPMMSLQKHWRRITLCTTQEPEVSCWYNYFVQETGSQLFM